MTTLPPSPFLSASDGLHPLSSVAVASGIPKPQGAAAEIQSSPDGMTASLPSGEREPSVMLACMSGDPAGSLVPAPQAPAGTIPLDYETILKALESCLHEDWIFGIDEPDPLVFLETFPLNARVA